MRATVYHGPRDMRIDQVPDPIIQEPTDVIARITQAGICGSDLWSYAASIIVSRKIAWDMSG